MGLLTAILALGFLGGLAMLFGVIANIALKRHSPARRAALAAVTLGVLVTIPAFVALIDAGEGAVPILSVAVATVILSALAFPLALVVTRRKAAEPDRSVFD